MTDKSPLALRAQRHYKRTVELAAELDAIKEQLVSAREQLKFAQDTCKDLMRMVDTLRAERDTWRAAAQ